MKRYRRLRKRQTVEATGNFSKKTGNFPYQFYPTNQNFTFDKNTILDFIKSLNLMPLVEFEITKVSTIDIESIRFANTFVDPTDEDLLNITSISLSTKEAIDVPTTNPILLVTIRASGPMVNLLWTFDITINGSNKTPTPERIFVDTNGNADFRKGYPY